MSWLTQTKGLIDHYKPGLFLGTQPIRVTHPVTMFMFHNTYDKFSEELINSIQNGELNSQIDLQIGEVGITAPDFYRTPRLINATRQIQLHETFLSYQWCITYAIYTLFLEKIDYPKMNKIAGYNKYSISQENIEKALEVFAYAKSLISYFSEWDKAELPNPEKYMAEKRDYVEQTNILYTEGMKFIMLHEYVHAKKHIGAAIANPDKSYYFAIEKEADSDAIDFILKGKNPITRYAVESGPIFGLLSMLYFRSTTTGIKHPNVEDRITWALEKLEVEDNEYSWAFACVGLELWAEQFGINFDWTLRDEVPYKFLYYDIVNQLKKMNNEKAE